MTAGQLSSPIPLTTLALVWVVALRLLSLAEAAADQPDHSKPSHNKPGHQEPGHQEPGHQEPGHPAGPNVLVIIVDDLGYGDLSCYGATDLQSPHIDALADKGVRFTDAYANCPVCSPTRASLLTGRYPDLVGVPGVIRTFPQDNWGFLDPAVVTLPQVLSKAGYHTALVGKWHLGLSTPSLPGERGFAFVHGFLGDMMDDYYTHLRHGNNYMRFGTKQIDPQGHATELFTRWAQSYLRERAKAEDGRPFFLYLAYNAPHTPIQPPTEWVQKVKSREKDIPQKRAKLVALIEHLDAGIGEVLATLEQTGLAQRTLVVFVSDNGGQVSVGANNGPLRSGKGTMYEGGIRVPMIVAWPGKIPPGKESSRQVMTMDIFPTICEITGAEFTHSIEGVSFGPTLFGEHIAPANRDLFWVRREGGGFGGQDWYAMRRGDWKLVQNGPYARPELYNLKDDPQEQRPATQQNRKLYNALTTALRKHIQRGGQVPWQRDRSWKSDR